MRTPFVLALCLLHQRYDTGLMEKSKKQICSSKMTVMTYLWCMLFTTVFAVMLGPCLSNSCFIVYVGCSFYLLYAKHL